MLVTSTGLKQLASGQHYLFNTIQTYGKKSELLFLDKNKKEN